MASGWGDEDARGGWYATRDFDMKFLQVLAGGKLPDAWQRRQNVQYLQDAYGTDCVVYKTAQHLAAELSAHGQASNHPPRKPTVSDRIRSVGPQGRAGSH